MVVVIMINKYKMIKYKIIMVYYKYQKIIIEYYKMKKIQEK